MHGTCGGNMMSAGADRFSCANWKSQRECTNTRAISYSRLEARVLTMLRETLMAPDAVAAFVDAYRAEANTGRRERQNMQRKLAR